MSRKTVKKCRRNHAKLRASERLGLNVTNADLDQISAMIRLGKSEVVHKQSLTKSVHKVEWKGQVVKVAYNKVTKQIVSFLPIEMTGDVK